MEFFLDNDIYSFYTTDHSNNSIFLLCEQTKIDKLAHYGISDGFHQNFTDRKFNRMRPSMARVLGLETRSAKEG